MKNGVFKPTTVGTPQGGVVSPLSAKITLDHLDWRLQEPGYHLARYTDDFVVVRWAHRQAEQALAPVEQVLTEPGL